MPWDGVVYHTYSTYARGLDGPGGMYQWLDRAPKGRNETGVWWRRHDEYKDGRDGSRADGDTSYIKRRPLNAEIGAAA
jgi:hypothetical protein